MQLVVEPAEARHAEALNGLFERTATPCHCQYWHFEGDKNAWLDRLFHAPELNRAAFISDLDRPGPKGIVALGADGEALGWLKLTSAARVPKLYAQRLYKGLAIFDGDRDGVLTVGCMLVDEAVRRRGVARALVRCAVELAQSCGAKSIEAFPRRARDGQASPAELWTGPPAVFLEAGFQIVNDFGPYPVLRYDVPAAK
jgi:GNAT superfamily N-acetyltransferase